MLVRISQLLIIINSSTNFFIYVCMDKGFQNILQKGWLCLRREVQTNDIKIRKQTRTRVTVNDRLVRNKNDMELLNINHNNN